MTGGRAMRVAVMMAAAVALSGCATTLNLPPTEAIRYHLGEPIARGTVSVEPVGTPGAPPSLEYQTYASAVQAELGRNGYAAAPAGTTPQFVAVLTFRRGTEAGPPRQSPVSIGLGGGGFSGGRRGGGVGLGGGIGFPLGGSRQSEVVVSELSVTIKRRVDQSPIWEGRAQTAVDARRPESATGPVARKLAQALFTNFPGESGRTIEVR
jgi:hypothetical protein